MTTTSPARRIGGAVAASALALAGLSAFGGQASTNTAPERVTFAKHVAPILQQKCQVCHQPNSIGPMPLVTYEDAREFARPIRTRVAARIMPPWHIDKSV